LILIPTLKMMVIAITMTPVRHKRHMQFLTSAPNLWGSADPYDLAFLSLWLVPMKCINKTTMRH